MKKIVTVILILLGCCSAAFNQNLPDDSIIQYVEFLKGNLFLSPRDYILKSFEEKDIVVLCERLHPEFKQYEMIVEVLRDKHFTGNIYTEVGVSNAGPKINEFLLRENLSEAQIRENLQAIFKNLDMFSLWPNYNFYFLIGSIYKINQERPLNEKIRLIPLDVIFSWDSVQCSAQYNMFLGMMEPQNGYPPVIARNTVMAQYFVRKYDEERFSNPNKKKALVIMNTYHGYTRTPKYLRHPAEPFVYSTAEYIYKTFPNTTKGILINGIANSGELVANGKWDAAFQFTGNQKAGFDLKGTPFGKTRFDMYNFGGRDYETVNFDYIFDGLVFYEPVENFEIAVGIPGIFDDPVFVEEFYRRSSLEDRITLEEAKSSKEIRDHIAELNVKKVSKIDVLGRYNSKFNSDRYKKLINRWLAK